MWADKGGGVTFKMIKFIEIIPPKIVCRILVTVIAVKILSVDMC